ncbi:uncharacterized protein YgbK (DUF1537 family) [Kineosphaera limosa]|uniref:Uncharacterized protein n=1 Tax=Kineosphaera limosa NBRC 100340 TaxID=1184609 RepID=K6X8E1_9MICO|nr:four-carbon acid sugar kinase family protein [Kineosphaera limosa]NYE03013.1 uncharacterized protein YgbK (DUF1537 family) [Kineosphaera limosa]GAB95094.1 hypothetical protein KILIM_016_00340 [Kineosphaera limosa NBRC 100340]
MATLEELTRHIPSGPRVDPAAVARSVADSGRVLVVLDDDPTGTQSVADLPVLTGWSVEDLTWALHQGEPAVYVMTNSRSLDPADARRVNEEVAVAALEASEATGVPVAFVSRGDSTLRGHFPLEPNTLAHVAEQAGSPIDGIVLVPAFADAGRITVGGVHYAGSAADGFTPVGESEFAKDATFGYESSHLRDWVVEKSGGAIAGEDVVLIDLATLRSGEPGQEAARILTEVTGGQVVAPDIVDENDLLLLALALEQAERAGKRFVYRVGPPFGRARIGQSPRTPLSAEDVERISGAGERAPGGLIMVGSHVGLTTRQLDALRERRAPTEIEIDVAAVLDDRRQQHLADIVDEVVAGLGQGNVVVRTSRVLVRGDDADASLDIARQVSAAVVQVVREALARRAPRFVVAKGGITSSDVATLGLQIRRAFVRGPMLPGIVSLWEPVDGPALGIPYIVFAGNVGGDQSLADVVDTLSA